MQIFKSLTKTKLLIIILTFFCLAFLIYISVLLSQSKIDTSVRNIITSYPVSYLSTNDSFIFTGDTGTGNQNQYDVANGITKYCDTNHCTSMFILGDVIYESGVKSVDDPQFTTKFKEPYKNITMPIYIAFGNHDYLGCINCYLEFKSSAPQWVMPAKYYKVTFKDIDFFIINTEDFNLAQQQWLVEELTNSQAKWKIMLGHKPIKTNDAAHTSENWNGRGKLKEIVCDRADLYISGHSHVLEDIGKVEGCSFEQIVSGGGGAQTRQVINKDTIKGFYYESHGFVTLKETNNELELEFLNKNGELLFSRKLP